MRGRRRSTRDPRSDLTKQGLPPAPRPPRPGVPPKGHEYPSRHEKAILGRAALTPIMKTNTPDGAIYVYADDGQHVRNANGRPLTDAEWRRLSQWLDPQRDGLFDFEPQTWRARKP
jgi:hypothetical protein